MKTFEAMIYPNGRTISYKVRVQAANQYQAREILRMQYPNCHVAFVREVG
jgi:hypothetical protein